MKDEIRFCLPPGKSGRSLFVMRETTQTGVPAYARRTFATPPHPGTAETLVLR